jgi:hypothetical protein
LTEEKAVEQQLRADFLKDMRLELSQDGIDSNFLSAKRAPTCKNDEKSSFSSSSKYYDNNIFN